MHPAGRVELDREELHSVLRSLARPGYRPVGIYLGKFSETFNDTWALGLI